MKVTPEMVERALGALTEASLLTEARGRMRVALEAALAPLPDEPGWFAINNYAQRAKAAEAKLAKVQSELDEGEPMDDSEWRRTLRAILDAP